MNPPLSIDQVAALRQLLGLWQGVPLCLIGATALCCQVPDAWRGTQDLDLTVATSVSDLGARLAGLPGWRRGKRREHEWSAPGGVRVDVVPASPELLASGEVVWPESGIRMNLVGLRLALERALAVEVAPGLSIPVAPVSAIAVLKMAAYLDRPPERERDLEDLAHILDDYVPAGDPRRFSDAVLAAGITFEQAAAFLLGRDLAAMIDERERATIATFLAKVRDERDPHATQARMIRLAPVSWRREPAELISRLDALERGLNGSR